MSNDSLLNEKERFHIQIIVEEASSKLVFFPSGYVMDENGENHYSGFIAIPPDTEIVTLSAPYNTLIIKDALEKTLSQVDKFERWDYDQKNLPWEAKYYKTRSFRAAIKGKTEISVRSIDYGDGTPPLIAVDYFWPCKGSYQLYNISPNEIDRNKGLEGAAEIIMKMLETDFTQTKVFKISRRFLLL